MIDLPSNDPGRYTRQRLFLHSSCLLLNLKSFAMIILQALGSCPQAGYVLLLI